MITTTTMSTFARPMTSSLTTSSKITTTTNTATTVITTSPTETTGTTTSSNKSSMITVMLRAQVRAMIRESSMLNPRKNLRKRWVVRTTQNLCTNRLILGFQTKKKLNHIHILTLLFHFVQVGGEWLIHVPFLTDGHNLVIVLIHSLSTLLKPKILFTHFIHPSHIPSTRVHMLKMILNIFGSWKIET